MVVYFSLTLLVSFLIFTITALEYRLNIVLIGKFKLRKIKREENSKMFKLIIGIQILFALILLMLSIYIFHQ
jgi:hypothetical protein